MEKIKQFLISLGIGKNESEVYATLADYGTSSVLEISRKTKLHRSNIYDSLNNLISRGLVFKEESDKNQKFTARNPSTLKNYLKQKEIELDDIVKEHKSNFNPKKNNAGAKVTKGVFAIREILEQMITDKEKILVYGFPRETHDKIDNLLKRFHEKRVKSKIEMMHIYNSNSEELVKSLNKLKYTEARMLPSKYDSSATTIITKDKIYIIFWDGEPIVIQINGENVADPYKNYFEILWSRAKAIK